MSMVVVSVRIPKELKMKAKNYGIKISEILRRALEEEIRKRELEEIQDLLDKFKKGMENVSKEDIISVIKESREERLDICSTRALW